MIFLFTIVTLLAMALVGFLFINLLLPQYGTLGGGEKAACALIFGWPLLLFIVVSSAFFYIGWAILLPPILLGLACLVFRIYKTKPSAPVIAPQLVVTLESIAWISIILVSGAVILSAVVMAWPPTGDIIIGHAPRTALFQYNQKVPLTENPYLILYPPGLSALSATFNSLFGLYPGMAVLIIGSAIMVSMIVGIFFLSKKILKSHLLALLPVLFMFIISPDANMERWIIGHYLSGTYANLIGYLILVTYIVFIFFFMRSEAMGYRKLLAVLALYSGALLFTYPPFLVFVILITVSAVALVSGRSVSSLGTLSRHFKLLLAASVALFAVLAAYVLSRDSYLTTVIIGYISGGYVLGGSGVFGSHTAYILPVQTFLLDWRNLVLIFSLGLMLYEFWARKNKFAMSIFVVPTVCAIISMFPPLSDSLWFFFSSRSIPFFQVIGFVYFCYFLREYPYAWLKKKAGSSRGNRFLLNLGNTLPQRVILLSFMVVAITAVSAFASTQSGSWGWYTKTPYFADDIGGVQFLFEQTAIPDLILGDGSSASQYIMTLGVRNLTCFDFIRVSQPDLFNDSTYYWEHPSDVAYLHELIMARNITWIYLGTDPMRVVVDQAGYLVYQSKPFPKETYLSILDNLPFLQIAYQSGETRVYRVTQG